MQCSYCFDDVLMDPCLSDVKSRKDISLTVNIARYPRELILKTPLISSCMSTVTESQMAIDMSKQGGLGIVHRYMSVEKQVEEVRRVKRYLQYVITEPYTLKYDLTMASYELAKKKYGIGTFLITDDENKLVGLITKKDYDMWKLKSSFSSVSDKIIDVMSTGLNGKIHVILSADKYDIRQSYDTNLLLEHASALMTENKIEKIPIVDEEFRLVGLITHKNINHYMVNKSYASLDKFGRFVVGAAVGIKDGELDRLAKLVEAGLDVVCVDVANGFNLHVKSFILQVRSIYPNLVIMAGNVCNADGYIFLNELDVDCIRVGIGSGSICTTRLETGIGKGQWSAIDECFKEYCKGSKKWSEGYGDWLEYICPNPKNAKIISDGGSLGKTGNKAKALATGASAVMLGQTLAGTLSSPGSVIDRNGKKCKYFRGMASTMAYLESQEAKGVEEIDLKFNAEGVDGFVEIKGSVNDIIEQINSGIRSSLSYLGCNNINELHDKRAEGKIKFSVVTSIGMTETMTRIKTN